MECTICELYDYADSFWKNEICIIFFQMNHIRYVPIRIKEVTQERLGKCVHTTLGTGKECEMVLISTQGSSNEKIKTVIRHELVHYALSMMNLKHDDADAAFKISCEYFNADWYKELNELESKIYDTYNSYFKKAVDLCHGDEELSHHIGDIISIMGSKDITSVDLINEQFGRANFIIDAIQTLKNAHARI